MLLGGEAGISTRKNSSIRQASSPVKLLGQDACKLAVQPSKAKARRWSILASASASPNAQVPETTANDEYVAALKREFHATLVRVLLGVRATRTSTCGACMWEARTLDKASEEKASDQCCGSSRGVGDGSVACSHV